MLTQTYARQTCYSGMNRNFTEILFTGTGVSPSIIRSYIRNVKTIIVLVEKKIILTGVKGNTYNYCFEG